MARMNRFFFILLQHYTSLAIFPNISTDEAVLLAFKYHISIGPNHILATNWSSSSPVWCHSIIFKFVTRPSDFAPFLKSILRKNPIFLFQSDKAGSTENKGKFSSRRDPQELGRRSHMTLLYLKNNQLIGSISLSIFNISTMQQMALPRTILL
ncbi:uncharacterized protein LOC107857965, partial [Capsicum annuum]|uniref:uncharacterized protein LOC107857965 n=1 Tax=Capsicum annuum TaxID=4072 RepID=UPI001FB14600